MISGYFKIEILTVPTVIIWPAVVGRYLRHAMSALILFLFSLPSNFLLMFGLVPLRLVYSGFYFQFSSVICYIPVGICVIHVYLSW